MPGPNLLRPFRKVEIERRLEAVDLGDRRRERERPVMVPGVLPIKDAEDRGARRVGVGIHLLPGAGAHSHQRETGRAAEAFVGTGHKESARHASGCTSMPPNDDTASTLGSHLQP